MRTKKEVKAFIDAINVLRDSVTDDVASKVPEIFPKLNGDNKFIRAGTRINWDGKVKKAINDRYDTFDNNPDNAPQLWKDI